MEPKIQSTSWNPEIIENAILKKWEEEEKEKDVYQFAIDDKSKPAFVIDTPPPYPSGRPWHIGAAAHYAQIDMIARVARSILKKSTRCACAKWTDKSSLIFVKSPLTTWRQK
jgi:valyl-tRNA synthetase